MKFKIGKMLLIQKVGVYEIEITTYEGDGERFYTLYETGTKEDILDSVRILKKMHKWDSEVWDEQVPEFDNIFKDDWPDDRYGNLYNVEHWNVYYYNDNGIKHYVEVTDEDTRFDAAIRTV